MKFKGFVYRSMELACPFCMTDYIHTTEQRPMVKCPYCHGNGWEAETLTAQVEHILDNISDHNDDFICEMTLNLGPGYHRSEFRSYLRRKGLKPNPSDYNVEYHYLLDG